MPCADIFEVVATERGTRNRDRRISRKSGIASSGRTSWAWKKPSAVLAEYLKFELSGEEIAALAEGRWKQDRRDQLAAIRDQPHDEDRLLQALGEERLKARLPLGLYDAVTEIHGGLGPRDVARLMLAVQGDDTLRYLRDDLRDAGLEPPDRWAGSRVARTFVRDLGFSDEFAGAPSARRDPELVISGPPNLPPLHEYQKKIVDQIHGLLFGGEEHPRGLISLPTGAGKTRVAIQALVDALSMGGLESPILWIAPSDELCEQAVQTWSEVWRACGPIEELRIGRLWGPNEVPEASGSSQVVVATADKLRNRVGSDDYKWLSEATCVVIDEAHTAITPEYTKILEWLDISARGRARTTRAPLLGLTATPFRGTSEEETRRLVGRFGGRRLDRVFGDDDDYGATYRVLQEMGVLSRVDGEELETGTTIDIDRDLSSDERIPSSDSASPAGYSTRSRRTSTGIACCLSPFLTGRGTGRSCCSRSRPSMPTRWPPCSRWKVYPPQPSTTVRSRQPGGATSIVSAAGSSGFSPTSASLPRDSMRRRRVRSTSPGRRSRRMSISR